MIESSPIVKKASVFLRALCGAKLLNSPRIPSSKSPIMSKPVLLALGKIKCRK
jgi:hypothetical protein